MVYVENWDDFQDRSIVLFRSDPVNTRYVMKYRHCDGKLVLKVTDDKVVPHEIRPRERLPGAHSLVLLRRTGGHNAHRLPLPHTDTKPSKTSNLRRLDILDSATPRLRRPGHQLGARGGGDHRDGSHR